MQVENFYKKHFERTVDARPEFKSITDFLENMRYKPVIDYLVKQTQKPVLLELGYGSPSNFKIYSDYCDRVVVVDVVDRTCGVNISNIEAKCFDMNLDWPLNPDSFDVVIACMIFEHLFDPFHSFSELSKVMRSGSVAFVNLPIITSVRNRLRLLSGNMPITSDKDWFGLREWDGGHLHYFTIDDVERCASLFGLTLTKIHPVGRFLWLKKLQPSLFCHEITFELKKQGGRK